MKFSFTDLPKLLSWSPTEHILALIYKKLEGWLGETQYDKTIIYHNKNGYQYKIENCIKKQNGEYEVKETINKIRSDITDYTFSFTEEIDFTKQ